MSDTVKKNLGIVTAYGYARSKGYEGTEEEFAELMASYAEVAEDAAQSASEAAQSATNAAGSATAASGSAVSAANSATSASGSAQDAETAQAAAQQSATAAAGSATSASGSATAASGSAAQAAQSATSAAGSATSAQSYSSTAASAAQAASGSADDADTSATAAAASAAAAAESARTLTIDDTLTQQGQAADSKKTGDEISAIKADLGQITEEKADTRQLYDNANPSIINCYANGLKFLSSNSHRILYIPCEPNTQYTISADNTLWTANGVYQSESEPVANGDCMSFSSSSTTTTVVENGRKYITNTTESNAHYLAVFYYNANTSPDTEANIRATIMIAKGGNRTEYIPYDRLLYIKEDRLPSTVAIDTVYDRCITGEEATMETGDSIEFDSPNIKKNNLLTFSANISSFGSFKIGQGRNALNQTAYIIIDATTVKVYRYATQPIEWISLNHGLTI